MSTKRKGVTSVFHGSFSTPILILCICIPYKCHAGLAWSHTEVCTFVWVQRDIPEIQLVLLAEVHDDSADRVTECVVQQFRESGFTLPARITGLPYRSVDIACGSSCPTGDSCLVHVTIAI